MGAAGPGTARQRIVDAAFACVERAGIGATTVEAIAREAGVGRATVYRLFPGGRDEVIEAAVHRAVADFHAAVEADVGDAPDVASYLCRGIAAGRHHLAGHAALQRVLRDEADQIVPRLAPIVPIVVGLLRADIARRLGDERLRPGVDPDEAADLLARLAISYMGTAGAADVEDPERARRLVEDQLLAGVLQQPAR